MYKSVLSVKQFTMILLVLIIMLLVGCQPGTTTEPTSTPVVEIEVAVEESPEEQPEEMVVVETEEPILDPIATASVPEITIPRYGCEPVNVESSVPGSMHGSGFYVDDQIILTGKPGDINYIVETLPEIEGVIHDIDGMFDYYIVLPQIHGEDDLALGLYELNLDSDPSKSVWDVVKISNSVTVTENGEELFVFAEPNYITNNPLTGSPSGGGSGIVGDPDGEPDVLLNGQIKFSNQSAFWSMDTENSSINLFDPDGNWVPGQEDEMFKNSITSTVEVAVFDTVPSELNKGKNIDWAVTPFDLCVWKPGVILGEPDDINEGLEDHGLYAVGLAQGISPAAHYHLIEVLNANAEGDLFSLIRAMDLYTQQRWNDNEDQPLEDTVLNLSLGLAIQRGLSLDKAMDLSEGALGGMVARLQNLSQTDYPYLVDLLDKFPIVSLQIVLGIYDQAGAVIVAASGNDGKEDHIQPPAAFSQVIGVASSNKSGVRSAFSNAGNLAAPGGDEDPTNLESCLKNSSQDICHQSDIVSLIYWSGVESDLSYAYWRGTSFSTPIVSGLVALVMDATSNLLAEDIRNIVYCSTDTDHEVDPSLGAGVIDVQKALSAECIR